MGLKGETPMNAEQRTALEKRASGHLENYVISLLRIWRKRNDMQSVRSCFSAKHKITVEVPNCLQFIPQLLGHPSHDENLTLSQGEI
jgi:hypothetical protein